MIFSLKDTNRCRRRYAMDSRENSIKDPIPILGFVFRTDISCGSKIMEGMKSIGNFHQCSIHIPESFTSIIKDTIEEINEDTAAPKGPNFGTVAKFKKRFNRDDGIRANNGREALPSPWSVPVSTMNTERKSIDPHINGRYSLAGKYSSPTIRRKGYGDKDINEKAGIDRNMVYLMP